MSEGPDNYDILRAALTGAGDLAYSWDLVGDAVMWVGDVAGLLGIASTEPVATGDAFHERINPEDLKIRLKALSRHFAHREPFDCEYRVRTERGGVIWIQERGSATFNEAGQPATLNGVLRVITARKQHELLLEQRASYDPLTGHFNRSRLREALDHALAFAKRYEGKGGYLTVGIDKMATINEAYGHDTADSILIGVGQRLEYGRRVTDIVGRVGGDRFGIILGNVDEATMQDVANRILDSFRRASLETPSGPVHVTVSIGGVLFPSQIETGYELMAAADAAMQAAKARGRNCFLVHEMSAEQSRRQRDSRVTGNRVIEALRNDRLVFAYQPVVEATDGTIAYYETLIRMLDGQGRVVPAGAFVPTAERLGLIRQIDRHTLEMAVADLQRDPEVHLALNISGLTASDRSWLRALVALVKGRPEIARRLIVEITETAALQDLEDSARFVAAVRDLGCRVALDDFGAGYTSFLHLKTLTVDIVKIDGSFVRGLGDTPDNQLFIRTLLNLTTGFGLKSVAECVETAEEAEILRRQGVTFLQGYHYGRPSLERPWDIPAGNAASPQAGD